MMWETVEGSTGSQFFIPLLKVEVSADVCAPSGRGQVSPHPGITQPGVLALRLQEGGGDEGKEDWGLRPTLTKL